MKSQPLQRLQSWLVADPYRTTLLFLITIYTVVFAQLAFDLHDGMRTHRSDLGQIDQAIWNSSRGRFLEQTDNGFVATRLTDHVEPILVLVSPVYWLWDDTRTLLLLQVLMAAVGALPLYALAMRRFEKLLSARERAQIWHIEPVHQLTRPLALGLAVAYLLAPQLQSAVLTEFHAAPLAVPLILWAFWVIDSRRWGQFVAAALLTALVKEEIALLAAGLGLWAIWRAWWDHNPDSTIGPSQRDHHNSQFTIHNSQFSFLLPGATVLLFSLTWFYLATFVIVPSHAALVYGVAESSYFQRYGTLGASPSDIVRSLFTQPQAVWRIATEPARISYFVGLLASFAWFPLLAPEILLLALPVLLANLLSAYAAQYYGEFHYSAPLIPYFAVAAAYGLGRLWRWLARRTDGSSASFQHLPAAGSAAMTVAALLHNSRTAVRPLTTVILLVWILAWPAAHYLQHGRGPLGGRYDPTPITAHHRLLDRFVAQLPPAAAVTATAAVHPHVSHRQYVYQFPLGLDAPVPADWALLDVTTNTDMAPGDLKARVDRMLENEWGVVDAADGFLLLRKGAPDKRIPDAFYTFVRSPAPAETVAAEPLRLLDVTADDWPRWRQTKLTAEWQVGQNFDPSLHAPQMDVVTPAQEVVATLGTITPPALLWYPPERWQPGEKIRVTTLPLALPRTAAVLATGTEPLSPAIFQRMPDGRLTRLPGMLARQPALDRAIAPYGPGPLLPARAEPVTLRLPSGEHGSMQSWLAGRTYAPGDQIDVWSSWSLPAWPPSLSVFLHLRHNEATVAQQDGKPYFFGHVQEPGQDVTQGYVNDWRQLTIPPDAAGDGQWTVVMGLYDPQTGERVLLEDADGATIGDELVVGTLHMGAPPIPDQACALVPASCAAQPQ